MLLPLISTCTFESYKIPKKLFRNREPATIRNGISPVNSSGKRLKNLTESHSTQTLASWGESKCNWLVFVKTVSNDYYTWQKTTACSNAENTIRNEQKDQVFLQTKPRLNWQRTSDTRPWDTARQPKRLIREPANGPTAKVKATDREPIQAEGKTRHFKLITLAIHIILSQKPKYKRYLEWLLIECFFFNWVTPKPK